MCTCRSQSTCNVGDHLQCRDRGLIPGWRRSPGEGNGTPLQYSCLGNPMERGAWWATVHGVTRVGHNLMTKPPSPHVNFKFLNYPFPWVLSEFRVQTELVAHWWGSWRGKRASPPPEEAEGKEGGDLLQVTSPRNGRSTPQARLGSLVSADEKTKPLLCGLFSRPELVPDYCGN